MQTEAINTTKDTEVSQEQEVTQSKSFNFSLDGNIGIQMAFMTGPPRPVIKAICIPILPSRLKLKDFD